MSSELTKMCKDMIPMFSLTMAGGLLFLFLGFYWMLVFWWSRNRDDFRKITFTVLMTVWFILALFFVGVLTALATEVYENSDVLIYNKTCDPGEDHFLSHNYYNLIPLMMLGGMTLVWLVHVCLFFITCCCSNKISVD